MESEFVAKNVQGSQETSQVMFVLDVTRSMSAEITGIKESINEFIAAIGRLQLQVEVGLTWFRDIGYDQRPGSLEFQNGAFTDDANEFMSKMDQLKASGGGGNPYESSKHGMFIASRLFTNPNTRKFMVLVTDQRPYPDGKGSDPSTNTLIAYLLKANIDQVYCVIRERWTKEFEPICDPLSAKVFNLPEDGRTPEAVRSILADISRSITTYFSKLQ